MTVPLSELAWLFLRLGATTFGGPAVHIAVMQDEVVRRRNWLTQDEFVDLVGATNLIPGPNSTEMAIHIGHRVQGWTGLVVAGAAFIVPATLIVTLLAWAYVEFHTLPPVEGVLSGVKPVIIAVVAQALWNLGRTCVKSWTLAVLGIVAIGLVAAGVNELIVLFGAGGLLAIGKAVQRGSPVAMLLPWANAAVGAEEAVGLWPLFGVFLKIGSVLFGSGYVLLAFLQAELVESRGWLTEQQLLDAVAVGQVTPGPVFTTATFIGYLLGGVPGAAVATAGIFLPAFVFVALSVPILPWLRRSPVAAAFLDGVNVASLALMAVVTWQLAGAALVDWISVLLAVGSAVLLLGFRVNSSWLVLAGAAVGLIRAIA